MGLDFPLSPQTASGPKYIRTCRNVYIDVADISAMRIGLSKAPERQQWVLEVFLRNGKEFVVLEHHDADELHDAIAIIIVMRGADPEKLDPFIFDNARENYAGQTVTDFVEMKR